MTREDPGPPQSTRGRARIGTAGWAVPRGVADQFAGAGTGLQRYASRFNAVEINSTFYRRHQPSTFAKWAAATPDDFRFAVKAPRQITHHARLVSPTEPLEAFLDDLKGLDRKLGPILVQLPPSLVFEAGVAGSFFEALRDRHEGLVACEPRHVSWFEPEADDLLRTHHIGRVGADPARHPEAARPGGWRGLFYWRLHGSPRMYYSAYDDEALQTLSRQMEGLDGDVWCAFDNTASGAAASDALRLIDLLKSDG